MQMEGLLHTQFQSTLGVRTATLTGQLELNQLYPIPATLGVIRTAYNTDVMSTLQYQTLEQVLTSYSKRNETTIYKANKIIQASPSEGSEPYVDVFLRVNIPSHQKIVYVPSAFEALKFGWIQYFSLLLPVGLLFYYCFYGFVIKNKVFESVETSEVSRMAGRKI